MRSLIFLGFVALAFSVGNYGGGGHGGGGGGGGHNPQPPKVIYTAVFVGNTTYYDSTGYCDVVQIPSGQLWVEGDKYSAVYHQTYNGAAQQYFIIEKNNRYFKGDVIARSCSCNTYDTLEVFELGLVIPHDLIYVGNVGYKETCKHQICEKVTFTFSGNHVSKYHYERKSGHRMLENHFIDYLWTVDLSTPLAESFFEPNAACHCPHTC